MEVTFSKQDNENTGRWDDIFKSGGPRNFYPHSYVVSWYFQYVRSGMNFSHALQVLDIGCGTAPDLLLFASQGIHYYGIDVTAKCFPQVRDAVNFWKLPSDLLHLQLFSPPALPFDREFFDLILGLESLHFNADQRSMREILAEVHRVLRPQGHFFFTTIDRDHYFVKSAHSKFVSENCLEILAGFPDKHRVGLRYYVFSDTNEIKLFFHRFSQMKVGKYLLDIGDGQPDSYYVIFGKK